MVYKKEDYIEDFNEGWCPGCGNFGIREACLRAFENLQLDPNKTVVVSGIGCSGKGALYYKVFVAHTLHGRTLPVAIGLKLANPELNVIVHSGDGDCYGIGVEHFVSTGRYNPDITLVVFDNSVYALTKGQASPTLKRGEKLKSLPAPNIKDAINPIGIALLSGYNYIAQGYAFNIEHLSNLIAGAIKHKGLSLVNVKQPCITYDDIHTKDFYQNALFYINNILILTKDLDKPIKVGIVKREFSNHKIGELVIIENEEQEKNCYVMEFKKANEAVILPKEKAEELLKKECARKIKEEDFYDEYIAFSIAKLMLNIPIIGKIYERKESKTYEERIAYNIESYFAYPPAKQIICDEEGNPTTDIRKILDSFIV
ncbi:MAG: thiamine pyrophosphate-dependent enzyme [Candidatus Aenigmarchaeota archaeon]|nr:thiamine pyrophosphate-dependent enzyme [Candidatus Aenigmarchaeota archaeon]MDW8149630.1 thiamine pyrophosphate-dependent enzyme [Candidatus Aenigmarchaeota archaeon]